jgi:hypothetical protein
MTQPHLRHYHFGSIVSCLILLVSSSSFVSNSKISNYDLDIYQQRKEHACLFVSTYEDNLIEKEGAAFDCTTTSSLNTTKFNRGEYFLGKAFIPYGDSTFDIVFLIGPFTNYSYLASAFLTAEVARVTKINGLILPFFKTFEGTSIVTLCTDFASFSSKKGYGVNYWIWRSYFMKYYIVNGIEINTLVRPTCIYERVTTSIFVNNRHSDNEHGDDRDLVNRKMETTIEFKKSLSPSFNIIKDDNDNNNNINGDKKMIVVIEPRNNFVEALISLLKNIIVNKPNDWKIQAFVGAEIDINKLPEADTNNIKIIYSILPTNNLDKKEYNNLLKSVSFWNQIDAEYIQIMQTDSALCKNSMYKLDDFIIFPYIGCSSYLYGWSDLNPKQPSCLGIGGFSMRTKSKMISCIENNKNEDEMYYGDGEDFFFSRCMIRNQLQIPSESDMRKYCLQQNVPEGHNQRNDQMFVPIGIHTAGVSRATRNFLSKRCPDGDFAL